MASSDSHAFSVSTPRKSLGMNIDVARKGAPRDTKSSIYMTNGESSDDNTEEPMSISQPTYAELEEIGMTPKQLEIEVKKYKLQTEIDNY